MPNQMKEGTDPYLQLMLDVGYAEQYVMGRTSDKWELVFSISPISLLCMELVFPTKFPSASLWRRCPGHSARTSLVATTSGCWCSSWSRSLCVCCAVFVLSLLLLWDLWLSWCSVALWSSCRCFLLRNSGLYLAMVPLHGVSPGITNSFMAIVWLILANALDCWVSDWLSTAWSPLHMCRWSIRNVCLPSSAGVLFLLSVCMCWWVWRVCLLSTRWISMPLSLWIFPRTLPSSTSPQVSSVPCLSSSLLSLSILLPWPLMLGWPVSCSE